MYKEITYLVKQIYNILALLFKHFYTRQRIRIRHKGILAYQINQQVPIKTQIITFKLTLCFRNIILCEMCEH